MSLGLENFWSFAKSIKPELAITKVDYEVRARNGDAFRSLSLMLCIILLLLFNLFSSKYDSEKEKGDV